MYYDVIYVCKTIFSHNIYHCFRITFLRDKIYLEKYCCEKLCVDSCCSDGLGRFTFLAPTRSSRRGDLVRPSVVRPCVWDILQNNSGNEF